MPASPCLARIIVFLFAMLATGSPKASAAEAPVLKIPGSQLEPLNWNELDAWAQDDHLAAFNTFMISCVAILQQPGQARDDSAMSDALRPVCTRATFAPPATEAEARQFFEKNFRPLRIATLGQSQGFVTGYYEPVVEGSRTWSLDFQVPMYRRPSNLIASGRRRFAANYFPNRGVVGRRFGRRKIVPYYDREEIENGILTGRQLEICWLKDPIDLLFIQIQGSARIHLTDGSTLRVNYDGYNGYPYSPIGKFLIENGAIPRGQMSMDRIREWMQAHPEEAREISGKNRSYVFFRKVELGADDDPKGGEGVPLTPGRSIAVDRPLHAYGTPFFIEADLPIAGSDPSTKFRRLMVAQDTGGAIVGPARADLYFGSGDEAGKIAGRIRHPGLFAMLVPRELDPFEPGRAVVPLPPLRPPVPIAAQGEPPAVPLPRPRPKIELKS